MMLGVRSEGHVIRHREQPVNAQCSDPIDKSPHRFASRRMADSNVRAINAEITTMFKQPI